jgi:hypothetical protein
MEKQVCEECFCVNGFSAQKACPQFAPFHNLSSAAEGGHADFDFFHQQHDGPKTARKE